MITARERGDQHDESSSVTGWRRPVQIGLPAWVLSAVTPEGTERAARAASSTARALLIVIPAVIAVLGLSVASMGAVASNRQSTEALGTLGVEIGAAMWFGGAVVLGGRPHPTALRIKLLVLTGLGGVMLILTAFAFRWSGVLLDLAMEFGVGAVAVVVLDFLVLGVLQRGLQRVAVLEGTTRPHPPNATMPRQSDQGS